MSTIASRVNSPPTRQASSPKYSPTKYLSSQNSSYYAKHQQKQNRKSPTANRGKLSPAKPYDTRSTFSTLVSPTGTKKGGSHRYQPSVTVTGKNSQKIERQKTRTDTENVMPFDSRLEQKGRKSDHHVKFTSHENEIPAKLKSYSVKSAYVPQEALMSPGPCEGDLAGVLTPVYNRQVDEKRSKADAKRKVNSPEGSPLGKSKNLGKSKFKDSKISPRVYELIVGSPTQQEMMKVKNNNYVKRPLKDVSEQYGGNGGNGQVYSSPVSPPDNSLYESKVGRGMKVGRTGSVQNEGKEDLLYGEYDAVEIKKTTKYSEPNIYEDGNVYNSLFGTNNRKGNDYQQQQQQPTQEGRGDYVFSTRSAMEFQENRYTEEKLEQENAGNQLISELLKGNALKEIKMNPNAKFLTLRKQVQERRNNVAFKSADWRADENIKKMLEQNQTSPTKAYESSSPSRSPIQSPHVVRSVQVSESPVRESKKLGETRDKGEEDLSKEQLMQLFERTKVVLSSYKNKENNWEKERKMFVTEIQHLRRLVQQGANLY